MNKKLFTAFLLLSMGTSISVGEARLIFTNEDPIWDGSEFVIDAGNETVGSNINLKFGQDISARIQFDRIADNFKINRNLDFENNQIQNVRLENLAAAPTCDGTSNGRVYFNTTNNDTFVCDGADWVSLSTAEGIITNGTEQTLDYNTLPVSSINVLSSVSTNRPSDNSYIVKTLGDAVVKTQVATNSTNRYFRIFQSSTWGSWQSIKTSIYTGYSVEDIDQTDGTASYIGRTRDSDGKWLITRSVTGGYAYAQEENNGGTTDFATAWVNRLTLVYISSFSP